MEFCCLGSGSKGNATLIKHNDTVLMIDCGFSVKSTLARLEQVDCRPESISAILVTHEHSDHISGVARFAKRFNVPVYSSRGTARTGKLENVETMHWIVPDNAFSIDDMAVMPVAVPHDANEPCQFVVTVGGKRLGIVTDLGSVSEHVYAEYKECDALLLEANHDLEMLWAGKYPPQLKQRVASDWGHLSNAQAKEFLHAVNTERLSTLVLGHLSEQNNCIEKVKGCFSSFEEIIDSIIYACQKEGFGWITV